MRGSEKSNVNNISGSKASQVAKGNIHNEQPSSALRCEPSIEPWVDNEITDKNLWKGSVAASLKDREWTHLVILVPIGYSNVNPNRANRYERRCRVERNVGILFWRIPRQDGYVEDGWNCRY